MDGFGGRIEVDGCDTIPKLFWHQVKARDERTAFREKTLGIWRATSWRQYGERARAVGMGLVKLGLQRGDVVSVLADTVPEWLYVDMGTMGAGGVTNGIYPTDSAKQVDYIVNDSRSRFLFVENEEQLDKFLEVRERCPSAHQGLRPRHGGPRRLQGPDGHAVRRADDARPRVRQGDTRRMGEAGRRVQGRGAGAAGLHFGHDRGAEGRHDLAPQRDLPAAQRRCLHPARHRRRAARLPAALPHRRAHLHHLPAATLGRDRQLRRKRRDGAGERARGGADHLLRRAAHLGALLFRHHHPHEGGDLDRPHSPTAGRWGWG